MFPRRPHRTTVLAVAVWVPAIVGCAGNEPTSSTPAVGAPVISVIAPEGRISWQPCQQVSCGTLKVALRGDDPAGASARVSVYRRAATVSDPAGTLVLIPDYSGPSARELAETALVFVGPAAHEFDILAVSPRGSFDSGALACGTGNPLAETAAHGATIAAACTTGVPAGEFAPMGTLAAVRDLEALLAAENLDEVSVVGWGRGATVAAAWKLLHPRSIRTAVLDSPEDPGISPARMAAENLAAEDTAVAAAMKWCTSHISCPLMENAAKRTAFVLEDIDSGAAGPGVSAAVFRHALRRTVASGDVGTFFRALAAAEKGDFAPLVGLSGRDEGETSFPARVAVLCSDLSSQDIAGIAAADAEFSTTTFRAGWGATFAHVCAAMPEALREPLGSVRAAPGARSSRTRVYVAASDGVVSPAAVRAFARRADWKFKGVKSSRHLVVGHDRSTTLAVSRFLLGETG